MAANVLSESGTDMRNHGYDYVVGSVTFLWGLHCKNILKAKRPTKKATLCRIFPEAATANNSAISEQIPLKKLHL